MVMAYRYPVMKKKILFVLVLCGAAVAATIGLKDGVYKGQANGYKGPLHVEVTVKGGRIAKVEVAKSRDKFLRRVEKEMPRRIVEANSADVDVISGATITSRAIKRAVSAALKKAP